MAGRAAELQHVVQSTSSASSATLAHSVTALDGATGEPLVQANTVRSLLHHSGIAVSCDVYSHYSLSLQLSAAERPDVEFDDVAGGGAADTIQEEQGELMFESADPSVGRSWLGWAAARARGQVECSVTAVGLVWWVSSMLSPAVSLRVSSRQCSASATCVWLY